MEHIKKLYNYQSGIVSPRAFVNAEARRVASTFETWRMCSFPRNHRGCITSLDVDTLHGQFLLASSTDSLVRVHNILYPLMENSSKFDRPERYQYCSMKCRHDGVQHIQWYPHSIDTFTSSGLDGTLKLWNTETMKSVVSFAPCREQRSRIFQHSQSVTSRSPLVAVATSEHSIPVLDLRYYQTILRLPGHFSQVFACEWSTTDCHLLASGGSDGRLRLWDMRNIQRPIIDYATCAPRCCNIGQPLHNAHGDRINGIQFTVDGTTLMSYSMENSVKMWDVYGGRQLDANCGMVPNRGRYHMQFTTNHTNSPALAFVPTENQIFVIQVTTGEVKKKLRGHFSGVRAVTYNPFFEELYSAGNDRQIIVWKPHQEQVEALQCRIDRHRRVRSIRS